MAKHTTICSIEDLAEMPFFNEANINSALIDCYLESYQSRAVLIEVK
jgi:hypothetical protein